MIYFCPHCGFEILPNPLLPALRCPNCGEIIDETELHTQLSMFADPYVPDTSNICAICPGHSDPMSRT